MTNEELTKVLEKHKKWLCCEGGIRANLYEANLRGANLYEADLRGADLRGANLYEANLRGADLYEANLYEANLRGANLYEANLRGANLYEANLRGADLRGANLCKADLRGADLCKTDLCGANLRGANLCGAKLDEKEMIRLGIILKKEMIGYKKLDDGTICKLAIPKGAIVFSINNGKCRTNKATVLEGEGVSIHDHEFEYEVGKELEIGDFCLAYNEECASGIHFFRTRKEAENYED